MKKKTISGRATSGKLKHWITMLDQWIDIVEEFGKVTGDKCYYYSERTNVGMLAVAAAKNGGVALEEFPWTKKGTVKAESKGRADLWLRCKARGSKEEYVEAKFKWLHLKSRKPYDEIIRVQLKAATKDARKTRNKERGMSCVALVFFPTYIPKQSAANIEEIIHNTVAEFRAVQAELSNSAIAWCFPAADQMEDGDLKGNLVPGVIIVAKAV